MLMRRCPGVVLANAHGSARAAGRSHVLLRPSRARKTDWPLGFTIDELRFPTVLSWLEALRQHPVFAHDRRRTAEFLKQLDSGSHERRRLFWSGDRLEWLLSRGFYGWFAREIADDRVAYPEG
jgi:hypothetical protein